MSGANDGEIGSLEDQVYLDEMELLSVRIKIAEGRSDAALLVAQDLHGGVRASAFIYLFLNNRKDASL